ncbi:hypothetical protein [Loktanella sp. M215]|uniref:hypothetical protein n=1 Tax=Loktanella sp. M215 TaxID=2675431 RepID=UPI001F239F78|nr:hypothetical protein [Loktanella sp. M215]MCF7702413.1 hypothetical protein [Loktanella sp. M215]
MANNLTDPKSLGPSAVVSATANIPLAVAWERFVPIELPMVFPKAKGPIPPVVAVEGQTGRWDEVGMSRTVVLGDGARLREQITLSNPTGGVPPANGSARFGYMVSGFSGPLGWMTNEARGLWQFEEVGEITKIIWTYGFKPTSVLSRPILGLIIAAFGRNICRTGCRTSSGSLSTARHELFHA